MDLRKVPYVDVSQARGFFLAAFGLLATSVLRNSNHAFAFSPQLQIHIRPLQQRNFLIGCQTLPPLFMTSTAWNETVVTSPDNDDRDIQLKGSQLKPKMLDHEEGPVTSIHSVSEFLDAIENTHENELIVVK